MLFATVLGSSLLSLLAPIVSGGSCDYVYYYGFYPIAADECTTLATGVDESSSFIFSCNGTTGWMTNYSSSACDSGDMTSTEAVSSSLMTYLCGSTSDDCDVVYASIESYIGSGDCSSGDQGETYLPLISNVDCDSIVIFGGLGGSEYRTWTADTSEAVTYTWDDENCTMLTNTSTGEPGCEESSDGNSTYAALGDSFMTLSSDTMANNNHCLLSCIIGVTFAMVAKLMV